MFKRAMYLNISIDIWIQIANRFCHCSFASQYCLQFCFFPYRTPPPHPILLQCVKQMRIPLAAKSELDIL